MQSYPVLTSQPTHTCSDCQRSSRSTLYPTDLCPPMARSSPDPTGYHRSIARQVLHQPLPTRTPVQVVFDDFDDGPSGPPPRTRPRQPISQRHLLHLEYPLLSPRRPLSRTYSISNDKPSSHLMSDSSKLLDLRITKLLDNSSDHLRERNLKSDFSGHSVC